MTHETLYALAHAAGLAAAQRMNPTPMVVAEHVSPLDDSSPIQRAYYVPDGVCGFAWIVIKPGTCSFARWLVKNGHAKRHYYGGVSVWVGDFNQSLERKEAYATAFANALRLNGVKAHADSRMD